MKNLNEVLLLALCFSFSFVSAQTAPQIEWQNTIGGNSHDDLYSVIQTTDGGYLLGGYSYSNITGDKTEVSQGGRDYWVVKLDDSGNIDWQNTIGGNSTDDLYSVIQTNDGGYLLGGYSNSGISGDKSEANVNLSYDYWVVKLNGSGNIEWQNTIGGNYSDFLLSVTQTTDDGYLLGGFSYSDISGDKTEASLGFGDYWVVKLDGFGNLEWQNTIGGNSDDILTSVIQTTDGSYLLGGYSVSGISGDKTEASQGISDYWVVKLNGSGNIEWQNTIGGNGYDDLESVIQTIDGSYLLGGYSDSGISGDKTKANYGGYDYWVVNLNDSGTIEWQNAFGGSSDDALYSIIKTFDGGYLLGGYSNSGISGNKTEASQGYTDFWIIKLNGSGNMMWQNAIGGNSDDFLRSVVQTSDGGYLLGGISYSGISGDKTEANLGDSDYWVVKLFHEAAIACPVPTSLSAINVTPIKANLMWDAVPGAIGYRVKYKAAGTSQWTYIFSTDNQEEITGLTPNTEYGWQVRTVCSQSPAIYSDSSAHERFLTPIFKLEGEMFSNEGFFAEVYPNPVQNQLTISLAIPASDITIRVYDLQGKMIELPTTIANTQVQINSTSLPAGFYTLQITNNKTGSSELSKFVKQE